LFARLYLYIFEIVVKKILAISLLFLYLICVSGVQINAHYCGGKLKEISFFQINEKEGCCGKKMKSKNCCKDKITVLKINDIHKSVHDLKVPGPIYQLAGLIIPVLTLNFSISITSADVFTDTQDPPDLNTPDLYLRNRVFLI
jgi:hypothetical protein